MNITLVLLAAILSTLILESLTRWFSSYQAHKLVNNALKKVDNPNIDLSYLDINEQQVENPPNMQLKIAIVAPFGLHKMALRNRVLPISLELTKHGHNITVFLPPSPHSHNPQPKYDTLGSVKIITTKPGPALPILYSLVVLIRMFRDIIKFRPNAIYGFKPIGYSAGITMIFFVLRRVALFRRRMGQISIFIDSDDWEGIGGWADRKHRHYPMRFIRDQQERIALRWCDMITVASNELIKNRVLPLRGEPKVIKYIKNSIKSNLWPAHDTTQQIPAELQARLNELNHPNVILLYTRYLECRAERLIRIFAGVLKDSPNSALLIIGTSFDEGSRLERLKLPDLAEEAGIDPLRIIQTGWVPYCDLRNYWKAGDVAIYPVDDTQINRSQSPVKLLELLADGKPVVADDFGEISGIITDKKTGLLVECGNDRAFLSAIIRLFQNRSLQQSLGYAANDMIHDQFNWEKTVNLLEEEIEKEVIRRKEIENQVEQK